MLMQESVRSLHVLTIFFFFFFSSRRRHTRFDCDWSSDVCSSDLLVPRIEPLRADLRHLRHVIVAGKAGPSAISLTELTAAASERLEAESTSPDDMCFWQYSSGTTGAPKAVVHLHGSAITPADLHGRHVVGMTAH